MKVIIKDWDDKMTSITPTLKHFKLVYKTFNKEYSTRYIASIKFWRYVKMYAETVLRGIED